MVFGSPLDLRHNDRIALWPLSARLLHPACTRESLDASSLETSLLMRGWSWRETPLPGQRSAGATIGHDTSPMEGP